MPTNKHLDIKNVKLDLNNYRTVAQKSEKDAINAMIAIKPDRFYAIIESLIDDGYLQTENLIILEVSKDEYVVKEGNRRTAALKLIHGIHDKADFNIPDSIKKQIDDLDASWKKENQLVPTSIFSLNEKDKVDKIINLTHAKGEKASRDPWTSVAKARQNRDEKKVAEPALDLLEKYISSGNNLTNQQKERWSGDYPYTVLVEALRYTISRLGFNSVADLVVKYPKITYRNELEEMLQAIGLETLGFNQIRAKDMDFAMTFNIPFIQPVVTPAPPTTNQQNQTTNPQGNSTTTPAAQPAGTPPTGNKPVTTHPVTTGTAATVTPSTATPRPIAYPINDQRTVTAVLRKFNPTGTDRQKLAAIKEELLKLKVKDNPIAFCFLLRSMFEISATLYCKEKSIPTAETKDGKTKPKTLQQLLSAVTKDLTDNNKNVGMVKTLHGANSELSKSTGLLSVTSMNQLVHNPSFSIAPHDIFTLFNNVYPLLEAMN